MESILKASRSDLIELLAGALALDRPYTERALQGGVGRKAAVLALFAFDEQGEPCLLLTRRTETVETHRGQMAFPGGGREEGDRDLTETALRETEEEVGIRPELVEVIGALPVLWTVTGFLVTPVVGVHRERIEKIELAPNPHEIAETSWIPLKQLFDPSNYAEEVHEYKGRMYPIHVFQIGSYRIWGATGAMIKNLLDRMLALRSIA